MITEGVSVNPFGEIATTGSRRRSARAELRSPDAGIFWLAFTAAEYQ